MTLPAVYFSFPHRTGAKRQCLLCGRVKTLPYREDLLLRASVGVLFSYPFCLGTGIKQFLALRANS